MKKLVDELIASTFTRRFLCTTAAMIILLRCTTVAGRCPEMDLPPPGECQEMDSLPRADHLKYYLAVKQGAKWLVCPSTDANSRHTLSGIGRQQKQELRWAAPPHPDNKNQVAYVSTLYREDQPFSLHRNVESEVGERPFFHIFPVFQDFEKNLKNFSDFVKFHQNQIDTKLGDEARRSLAVWHDTGLWRVNKNTYDVVGAILPDRRAMTEPEAGATERLIRIQANRPCTSWISIESLVKPGHP